MMNYYDIVPEINKVFYKETNEDWSMAERVIKDHQFIFITGGKGWFTLDGKTQPVKKGMLCYFYPNLVHSAETNAMDPLKFYYVHFQIANVDYNNGDWKATTFDSALPLNTVRAVNNYQSYLDMFIKLNESINSFTKEHVLLGRIILENMIVSFMDELKKQDQNYSKHLKVDKTIEFLQKNIGKKITLEDISELLEISPAYLSKVSRFDTC